MPRSIGATSGCANNAFLKRCTCSSYDQQGSSNLLEIIIPQTMVKPDLKSIQRLLRNHSLNGEKRDGRADEQLKG